MLGGTTATTGVESASLSFIGGGIDHAGFSYVPVSGGDSKLHLAFGGNMNPGNNASKVTFLAGGNVGIGTATPNVRLDVEGGTFTVADSAIVASATTAALPVGNLFHVSGVTTITSLTTCDAGNNGRQVTLIFDGILTLTDGLNLKLAGNFVTTADDSIQLVCDGTNWYETSRSVN